jgi:hypothetical protein
VFKGICVACLLMCTNRIGHAHSMIHLNAGVSSVVVVLLALCDLGICWLVEKLWLHLGSYTLLADYDLGICDVSAALNDSFRRALQFGLCALTAQV